MTHQDSGNEGRSHVRRAALTTFSLVLLMLGASAIPVCAQQTLADADWFERPLGAGVVWRQYLFDNLFGSRQSISYIEADLTNPNVTVELPYLVSSRQRTSSMVPSQVPLAVGALNGTYFETAGTGGHVTYLRIDGAVIPPGGPLFSSWGYEGALSLSATGAASMIRKPAGGWANDLTHPNIMACGPLLIVAGAIPSAALTAVGTHCTGRNPRSAVGITTNSRLILLAVDGRTDMSAGMTCEELALVMRDLGCGDALNLDGGGSTTLWGAGEQYNGVLNYPSDNGAYDHEGERPCSNAISITSTAPTPKTWDARLKSKTFSRFVAKGSSQTVSLVYENAGTGTWSRADTRAVLARPETRTSDFFSTGSWYSPSQPALMIPATVAPGETATFTFVMQAPDVRVSTAYNEHFMLTRAGTGRIGPADSEAWMQISVQPPVAGEESFIVESRAGGQNSGWYSDSGMADTSANCTATSCTGNIGMRYGSTYRSVAGSKKAIVAPDFPDAATYNVYVAWGGGSSRKTPITYHVIQPGTTYTVQLDQTVTSNTWLQLGTGPFQFKKGFSGSVIMTNEDIDVSGNMFAGAVMFEYVPPVTPDKTYEVLYLGAGAGKPVINGLVGAGEWNAASPSGTAFVRHDSLLIPAVEDGSFQMLFDDMYLYILFQMNDAYLAGYTAPATPFGYADLKGDKVNFFFTPFGTSSQPFYRIMFSPNPTNGTCYVWSQASLVKTTSATIGTDWSVAGTAAYSYAAGKLTIEYRVPWAEFDYTAMNASSRPADGDIWGVQPCISNEISAGIWESVNWEPDGTPSYVYGEPFGGLHFKKALSGVCDWSMY